MATSSSCDCESDTAILHLLISGRLVFFILLMLKEQCVYIVNVDSLTISQKWRQYVCVNELYLVFY